MAEATTSLAATIEAFDDARGDSMDGVWAYGVSWALMMRDVDARLVAQGLGEALEVVRDTGEAPGDLFGSPREHADELYERWVAESRLVLADSTRLMGLAVWSRRHRPPRRTAAPDAPAEVRWSVELTEILRTRYAMSAARVRDLVAEAHLHAAESGTTVQEEFGTPEEYAARFAPDRARRSRLTLAVLAGLLVLSGAFLVDGFSWTNAAMTGLLSCLLASEYRTYREVRR